MDAVADRELTDRLFATLVTPMKSPDYEVDEDAFASLVAHFCQPSFVDAGGAVVVNPEAGEVFYLESEERIRLLEIALEVVAGRIPVFAGIEGVTTAKAVKQAVAAAERGVDGLFVCPPIGSMDVTLAWDATKYPEVWIDMVKAIVDAAPLPVIAHPVSSVTPEYGIGFPLPGALKMLEEVPQVVGWKMTYPYAAYRKVARALREFPRHVSVLAANSSTVHESMANDEMDGLSTGGLNYAMEPMVAHIEAWRRGDFEEARKIWQGGLDQLHAYVWDEWSRLHIRYKVATWLRGLIPSPLMRPPLPLPFAEEIDTLARLLVDVGFELIDESEREALRAQLGGR